jgi:Tfp pilus assembly protein PilF
MDNRVWYDAVAAYSDVLAAAPNDQDARAARAEIYDQLAVTKPLAEADWRMVR